MAFTIAAKTKIAATISFKHINKATKQQSNKHTQKTTRNNTHAGQR